jgi:aquaporin Z
MATAVAFVAELAISFPLMSAILFTSNHEVLAPYTHYFAAIMIAAYIAFESPLSGMSTNPARTFGPAVYANYWHALWIYFIAPPMGMLAAAEMFLRPVEPRARTARSSITTTTSAASSATPDPTLRRQ